MGWRFHRALSLGKLIRLHLGKSGLSLSLGPRGASVNVRGRRVAATVGLPGTGLSYRAQKTLPKLEEDS